jgi:hypothetical protein
MDWIQFTIFIGSTIGLFFWNRSEFRSDMPQMMSLINEVKQEIKDLHGKLERLDAEFKAFLMREKK